MGVQLIYLENYMAFIAMMIAAGFIIIVAIGLGILLIGAILDIIWGVRKKKEKKVPVVLKVFAIMFTIWGVLQGIGPLALVGVNALKSKIDYRREVSSLPKDSVIHLTEYSDLDNGFDYKGKHFEGINYKYNDFNQWKDNEHFKTKNEGAIVFDNGKHYIIEKIENTRDSDIFNLGLVNDPYMAVDEVEDIINYYKNEAPYICDVSKDYAEEMTTVYTIDSDKIRAIRDQIETEGRPYGPQESEIKDRFNLYFYSEDAVYCVGFSCYETADGLIVESWGDYLLLSDSDASYFRSLLK